MLDATRLRVLVAIARHGSVTAAAQALNYAQPSISHHMARLESETGAKLMERSGRGIRLTDAGRLLAERAEEILGRLDAAEAELAAHLGLKQETVRLATFGSALGTLAAAAGAALRADRAAADISLIQAEPEDALRMLRVGKVDVALVFRYQAETAGSLHDPDLRFHPLLDEPVFLITPAARTGGGRDTAASTPPAGKAPGAGQPAGRRPASGRPAGNASPAGTSPPSPSLAGAPGANILAEYKGHRWIAGCERCQDVLFRLCRSAGFSPDIAVMTDDYVAAQALVAAGLGTAILPGLALRALRHPGIAAIELPGTRRHVLAATYGGPPERAAASALLTALGRAAAHFSGDRLGASASPA
ncbi:MAG TPA: LysR substrate-binding domain-containing protein [Streptosporangiaceae bacterium]|nr:LysR substrate-binding domain-containing protein [Streptosporangiaceae bacterium]